MMIYHVSTKRLTLIIFLLIIDFIGCNNGENDYPKIGSISEMEKMTRELNQTVWKDEIRALEHEDVFVRFWDDLRLSNDKYDVLKSFKFEIMTLGEIQKPVDFDWGVRLNKFMKPTDKPAKQFNFDEWRQFLDQYEKQGLNIRQSEWFMTKFIPPQGDQSAFSEVTMEIHLSRSDISYRMVVKGKLGIEWAKQSDTSGYPIIKKIDASEIQVLEHVGTPAFKRVMKVIQDVPLEDPVIVVQPLIVYDINGDQLPEILIGGCNSVMWNKGKFNFDSSYLFEAPIAMFNSGVVGDFTGDGILDYLGINMQRYACLFEGNEKGRFLGEPRRCWEYRCEVPSAITAGDIDKDGDLDIWFTQYKAPYSGGHMPTPYYDANDAYPSFLFLNDGKGNFIDNTEDAGLADKRFRRTYSTSFIDLDDDSDLDLLVVNDFCGLDIYKNDGKGQFTETTLEFIHEDERHAFGMAHTFGEFDSDGIMDFLMVGMNSPVATRLDHLNIGHPQNTLYNEKRFEMTFGNRLYQAKNDRYMQTSLNDNVAQTGWTWAASAFDFDNDGDDDLYVSNGHLSGESAKDFDSYYWTHDVYYGDSQERPEIAQYLNDEFRPKSMRGLNTGKISWNGFEHNKLLMNLEGKDFIDIGFLMDVGFEFDSRNIVTADLDLDGRMDLLVVESTQSNTSRGQLPIDYLHILKNQLRTNNHWIGVLLKSNIPGVSPIGAKVIIHGSFGTRERYIVTGDTYYAQHPSSAHFGLGDIDKIEKIEVLWINGKVSRIPNPQVDRYYTLKLNTQN